MRILIFRKTANIFRFFFLIILAVFSCNPSYCRRLGRAAFTATTRCRHSSADKRHALAHIHNYSNNLNCEKPNKPKITGWKRGCEWNAMRIQFYLYCYILKVLFLLILRIVRHVIFRQSWTTCLLYYDGVDVNGWVMQMLASCLLRLSLGVDEREG